MESTETTTYEDQTREWLQAIDSGAALLAVIEYDLEDEGYITTSDQPYATLTAKGRALL